MDFQPCSSCGCPLVLSAFDLGQRVATGAEDHMRRRVKAVWTDRIGEYESDAVAAQERPDLRAGRCCRSARVQLALGSDAEGWILHVGAHIRADETTREIGLKAHRD